MTLPGSRYIQQRADKSLCAGCSRPVILMCRINCRGPMFYICFDCQRIFEAGVGEVKKENQ